MQKQHQIQHRASRVKDAYISLINAAGFFASVYSRRRIKNVLILSQ